MAAYRPTEPTNKIQTRNQQAQNLRQGAQKGAPNDVFNPPHQNVSNTFDNEITYVAYSVTDLPRNRPQS